MYSILPALLALSVTSLTYAARDIYREYSEAEERFYKPSSPDYDAEAFSSWMDGFETENQLPEDLRIRLSERRREINTNRVGTKAADFRFTDRKGNEETLYGLLRTLNEDGDGKPLLLLFYDTDCRDCHSLMQYMAENPAIDIRYNVLAIDPYANSPGLWEDESNQWPSEWHIGISPGGEIDAEDIYILRTSPAIYLLNNDGTVVAKDCIPDTVIADL